MIDLLLHVLNYEFQQVDENTEDKPADHIHDEESLVLKTEDLKPEETVSSEEQTTKAEEVTHQPSALPPKDQDQVQSLIYSMSQSK